MTYTINLNPFNAMLNQVVIRFGHLRVLLAMASHWQQAQS